MHEDSKEDSKLQEDANKEEEPAEENKDAEA
jgi:hypothetical protein